MGKDAAILSAEILRSLTSSLPTPPEKIHEAVDGDSAHANLLWDGAFYKVEISYMGLPSEVK